MTDDGSPSPLDRGSESPGDTRAELLRDVRQVLVERRPDAAERILYDAGLNPESYLVRHEKAQERWFGTLRELDREGHLGAFLDTLRVEFGQTVPALEELCAIEQVRDRQALRDGSRAEAAAVFTQLAGRIAELDGCTQLLRRPEHPDETELAAVRRQLEGVYRALDKLGKSDDDIGYIDELTQLRMIEKRLDQFGDALQTYTRLLSGASYPEASASEPPPLGRLTDLAADEQVLMKEKGRLRTSLVRLREAARVM